MAEKARLKFPRMTCHSLANPSTMLVRKAFRTNILEDDDGEVDVLISNIAGKRIAIMEVMLRPFEVATLRLEI